MFIKERSKLLALFQGQLDCMKGWEGASMMIALFQGLLECMNGWEGASTMILLVQICSFTCGGGVNYAFRPEIVFFLQKLS